MPWDIYQRSRLSMEKSVLEQEFPNFGFQDPSGSTYITGSWVSNSYNSYSLRIQLPSGYPDECPSTYITSPSPLYTYGRQLMTSYGTSHNMHVWDTDRPGCVKICTYRPEQWSADQSIAKVIRKGLLWILAYECHLDDGQNIANFLQSALSSLTSPSRRSSLRVL